MSVCSIGKYRGRICALAALPPDITHWMTETSVLYIVRTTSEIEV